MQQAKTMVQSWVEVYIEYFTSANNKWFPFCMSQLYVCLIVEKGKFQISSKVCKKGKIAKGDRKSGL